MPLDAIRRKIQPIEAHRRGTRDARVARQPHTILAPDVSTHLDVELFLIPPAFQARFAREKIKDVDPCCGNRWMRYWVNMSPTSYKRNEMKGFDVLFPRQNTCQNQFHFWFHNRKVPRGIWPEDRELLREIKLVDTWGAKIDICLGRTMEGGRSWRSTGHNPRDGLTNQVAGLEIASSHAKGHGGYPSTHSQEAVVVVEDGFRGISVSGCQTAMGYILGNRWAHNLLRQARWVLLAGMSQEIVECELGNRAGWSSEMAVKEGIAGSDCVARPECSRDCLQRFRRVTAEFDSITDSTSESGSKYPDAQPPPPSHFRNRQAETESLLSGVESWSPPLQELMNGLIDDREILWREDMRHYGCSICECLPVEESTIEQHTWVHLRLIGCLQILRAFPPWHIYGDGNLNPKPRAPKFVQGGFLCKSMRSTDILNPASSWANQLQALCKVDEFIRKRVVHARFARRSKRSTTANFRAHCRQGREAPKDMRAAPNASS
ncbi:hypothetical protein DFH09DRAFT_1105133 [Mycena vulgaris]|nr:hypothetical protein DFH09DRAFT_1105133 [Mycena vulgaris]